MPELPEVEIVKLSLNKKIKDKKIIRVVVRNRKLRFKLENDFEKSLSNRIINQISRISKYIILIFDKAGEGAKACTRTDACTQVEGSMYI